MALLRFLQSGTAGGYSECLVVDVTDILKLGRLVFMLRILIGVALLGGGCTLLLKNKVPSRYKIGRKEKGAW